MNRRHFCQLGATTAGALVLLGRRAAAAAPTPVGTPSFTRRNVGQLDNELTKNGGMNTLLAVGDIDGDGFPDILLSGRSGRMAWFQNPGKKWAGATDWKMRLVDNVKNQECGGQLRDLLGRGCADLINGSDGSFDEMAWWENPGKGSDVPWTRRMIAKTGFRQMHDTITAVVTPDGKPSLIFTNQGGVGGGRLYRIPIPADPRVSPWPGLEMIAENLWEPNDNGPAWVHVKGKQPAEGVVVGDVDGDGQPEIVCGCHWFKFTGKGEKRWTAHRFTSDFITNKLLVVDIDGDGRNEIVVSEGDAVIYGRKEGGRFSIFHRPNDPTQPWKEERIAENLLDAHTLRVGDIRGLGKADILLGEIGVGNYTDRNLWGGPRPPRIWVYANDGSGRLTPHQIDEGTGTHEAVLVDMRGTGVLDIVGRPLHGPERWNLQVWYNDRVPLT